MGQNTPAETGFGARFLAAYRQLGGTPGVWTYASLMAMEVAGREGFDELLRRSITLPYRVLSLCASATPEDLAREVVEELKRQGAGALLLFGMWMGI